MQEKRIEKRKENPRLHAPSFSGFLTQTHTHTPGNKMRWDIFPPQPNYNFATDGGSQPRRVHLRHILHLSRNKRKTERGREQRQGKRERLKWDRQTDSRNGREMAWRDGSQSQRTWTGTSSSRPHHRVEKMKESVLEFLLDTHLENFLGEICFFLLLWYPTLIRTLLCHTQPAT